MKRLRILVVEDSLTVRRHLCEVLARDPALEVVGEAADGKRAIELCQALRPDAITLDMMLPVMSGLAATEFIMAYCPTPILVVSASVNRGELFKTYEALAAGAVEVMDKPGAAGDADWEARFVALLKLVARVRVVTHMRGRRQPRLPAALPARGADAPAPRLVALGASTGGPQALVEILRSLPAGFALPVLIVIHIGEPFGAAFAEWLDGQSRQRVRMAEDGMALGAGVLLAPPGRHLLLRGQRLYLDDGPERFSCRPSVDVLFESVARECGGGAIAALLTGMGQDGARGLLAVRAAGGATLAQDEASCVVYGMPREAALLNAAQQVLPLADIGAALVALAQTP
ncbi:chemotaxis-specific protein-glutamate methyltransferase CheB [Janthinobacterium fluminis]|uniref:Protein-glutamate methylesterase/protein-glutamine glutaminase n=1 Tax=Janthinobacterium fluminis TaxID=2987524 RepID=A0ABT5K0Q6_9BURK|nr:chemotaxis-specific protein-glutamate methyltransferase CheB [Janthinobacterium fluminis]MDC8758553.1 chemotaxis-specific protein-glutamate methyltransferase CheB [Janthinobacterium fluminis]